MITIYFAGVTEPEERTCEKFGYPNRDNKGETQYENTHFRRIDDAWEKIIAEAEAGVSLDTRSVKQKRSELKEAEQRLVNSVIDLETAKDNFKEFLSKKQKAK